MEMLNSSNGVGGRSDRLPPIRIKIFELAIRLGELLAIATLASEPSRNTIFSPVETHDLLLRLGVCAVDMARWLSGEVDVVLFD